MRSEFEFIESIRKTYSLKAIGDDCAVLPRDSETDQVITADLLIEDVDFRLSWTDADLLGHRSLAVSLSDIAAMGAEASWSMLSLGVPEDLWKSSFLDDFYRGYWNLAEKYGVTIAGGDISRSPDKLVIDSIVGGTVPRGQAILRSTAKPGDIVFVTGKLGGAAGGLKLLERGSRLHNTQAAEHDLLLRQLKPDPQLEFAKLLQQHALASSMIDISDGLSSDLFHICRESGVGATIDAGRIPTDPELLNIFGPSESFDMAVSGGEDFELLFTSAEKNISAVEKLGASAIGTVTANVGVIELTTGSETTILRPRGFRHF